MDKNINLEAAKNLEIDNEDIDLNSFLIFFIRNLKFISTFSIVFFIIACIFSLSFKRVWEGQFQIVLSENRLKGNNLSLRNISGLEALSGRTQSLNLNTEVGILESPSLLMPIYDFVIKEKKLNSDKNSLTFFDWKKSLKINLKKGTSILNISYRDKDKKLISTVLTKMTNTYQEYSGKNRKRKQDLTKRFLSEQINQFKKKSFESLRDAQNFAIENDLIVTEIGSANLNLDFSENQSIQNLLKMETFSANEGNNVSIEKIRASAANEIRLIDSQIKKIQEVENDFEKLQYINFAIPQMPRDGMPKALEKLEEELVSARTLYQENDEVVQRLIYKKDLLINLLKKRAIGYLKAKRISAEATMESATRPKEILLQYKELVREAERNDDILISLENNLRVVELEEAKLRDPWQLITKPTILKNPVGPSKKVIAFIGLLTGAFLGSVISLYKEKKSNKIFNLKEFEKIISTQLIEKFKFKNETLVSDDIFFFSEFIKKQSGKRIFFISLVKNDYDLTKKLKDLLAKEYKIEKEIELSLAVSKLKDIDKDDCFLLFSSADSITYKSTYDLMRKLNVMNIKLRGYFSLENI